MLNTVKEAMSEQCSNLERYAEQRLIENGLKSEDCQLVAIKAKLNELEALINGIDESDLLIDEDLVGDLVMVSYSRVERSDVDKTTVYALRKGDYDKATLEHGSIKDAFDEGLRERAVQISYNEDSIESFATFDEEFEEVLLI